MSDLEETEIKQSIQKAIQEHMPSLVGEELRKVLQEYENMKGKYSDALHKLKSHEQLATRESKLRAWQHDLEKKEVDIIEREKELAEKEQKFAIKDALIDLRTSHASEKVALMHVVVGQVFANNKMKYKSTEVIDDQKQIIVPGGSYDGNENPSHTETAFDSKTTTTETETEQ